MKRKAVVAIVTVMALALVIAPGVSAQGPIDEDLLEVILAEAKAGQGEHCYPADGYCTSVTYLDNENNAVTRVRIVIPLGPAPFPPEGMLLEVPYS